MPSHREPGWQWDSPLKGMGHNHRQRSERRVDRSRDTCRASCLPAKVSAEVLREHFGELIAFVPVDFLSGAQAQQIQGETPVEQWMVGGIRVVSEAAVTRAIAAPGLLCVSLVVLGEFLRRFKELTRVLSQVGRIAGTVRQAVGQEGGTGRQAVGQDGRTGDTFGVGLREDADSEFTGVDIKQPAGCVAEQKTE